MHLPVVRITPSGYQQTMTDGDDNLREPWWQDWVNARILLREADALLGE